jgi:hypothetical protein
MRRGTVSYYMLGCQKSAENANPVEPETMDNTFTFAAVALVAFGLQIAAFVIAYHKLSSAIDRLRQQLPKSSGNVIKQVEALLALEKQLGLRHPLPQTRGWAASPDFLRTLMQHALAARPACTVECSSGISTLVLARCAQLVGVGHVHSLEHDPEFAEKTRQTLRAEGLEEFATAYDAPLADLSLPGWQGKWYSHRVLPDGLDIDLLVVDGPPWFVAELPRYPALPVFHPQLTTGGVVFLDDAARADETAIVRRWLEKFADLRSVPVPDCEKGCAVLTRSQPAAAVTRAVEPM